MSTNGICGFETRAIHYRCHQYRITMRFQSINVAFRQRQRERVGERCRKGERDRVSKSTQFRFGIHKVLTFMLFHCNIESILYIFDSNSLGVKFNQMFNSWNSSKGERECLLNKMEIRVYFLISAKIRSSLLLFAMDSGNKFQIKIEIVQLAKENTISMI